MKEIGGYIEFEYYHKPMLHQDALKLNCGRNCLAYLIRARKIRKIVLPYFLCNSVRDTCKAYGAGIRYYYINKMFMPEDVFLESDEWLYLVNYYGQLSKEQVKMLVQKYKRVIVDYAQAYFEEPAEGADSLYTCRKFFGVPDGAVLYTDAVLDGLLEQDESFDRMQFLMGRLERSASEFYREYVGNNSIFVHEPIKVMSKLTQNILCSIDYNHVKDTRTGNFTYLSEHLGERNLLCPKKVEGAFAYPLLLENGGEIRKKLITQKIYVPTLWPNVLKDLPNTAYEYHLAENILPLPCDQRYTKEDMEYVCRAIEECRSS